MPTSLPVPVAGKVARLISTTTLIVMLTTSVSAQRLVPSRALEIPTPRHEWAYIMFRDSARLPPEVARYVSGGIIVRVLATKADSLEVEVFEWRDNLMRPADTVLVAVPTFSRFVVNEYHSLIARRDTALESALYASLVGGLVGAVRKIFDRDASIWRSAAVGAGVGALYGAVLPYRAYGFREYPVTFTVEP